MEKKFLSIRNIAVTITIFLISAILLIIYIYLFVNPQLDLFTYLGASSTLAIAFLTVAYVVTTSQQLSVMNYQLIEMKKSRELLDQPLPFIEIREVVIKKPRLFYTPPKDEYSWQSIYNIKYSIRNISNYPAINVCVYPKIIPEVDGEDTIFDDYGEFFEILSNEDKEKSFSVTSDPTGTMIKAITTKGKKNKAVLIVKILFKNILGACFCSEHHFDFIVGHPKDFENTTDLKDKFDILKNWYEKIHQFEETFRNELQNINKLTPHMSAEWRVEFDKINNSFKKMLNGEDQFIDCRVDSEKYTVKIINSEQYSKEVELTKFDGF